jgi:hypothetical protein
MVVKFVFDIKQSVHCVLLPVYRFECREMLVPFSIVIIFYSCFSVWIEKLVLNWNKLDWCQLYKCRSSLHGAAYGSCQAPFLELILLALWNVILVAWFSATVTSTLGLRMGHDSKEMLNVERATTLHIVGTDVVPSSHVCDYLISPDKCQICFEIMLPC